MRKLLVLAALGLSLTGCSKEAQDKPRLQSIEEKSEDKKNSNEPKKHEETIYEYFDTITAFIAYTDSDEDFEKYSNILKDELSKYHKLYNSYDEFEGVNNFLTINQNAGKEPVKVDPEIIDLIEYSKKMYELTDGKINIAMGSLLGLWHDYRQVSLEEPEKAAIPKEDELKEASKHSDIEKIIVDKEKSTVFIEDPNIKIDIGAIGKGYATQKISQRLEEEGLTNAILSVGGDDVLIGENPSREDGLWKIAIKNPDLADKENPYVSIVGLIDTSVVTSGDYQRFFEVDGKKYHHIIDPATMYPSTKWKSVSVAMDDIALADTISTYLFIVDLAEGKEIAEKMGAKVLWVDTDGKEYRTDDWEELEERAK